MKRKRLFFFALLFLLSSCYQGYLYVQQEKVGKDYLASTHVNTPDPRQKHPPIGQKIIVSWDFPLSVYRKDLTLILEARFWDQTQKEEKYPIEQKRGCHSFFFPNETKDQNKKILTYRLQVVTKEAEILQVWEHQLWTKRIDIDLQDKDF